MTDKREATHGNQCPDETRDGFVFSDEFSADWNDLDQTEVLVFHSWIAEYVKVENITVGGDGRKTVLFQKVYQKPLNAYHALRHAPIGKFAAPGGWRFLIFNNRAVLDAPGESVCVKRTDGVEISYIPLHQNSPYTPVMAQLKTILSVTHQGENRAKNIKISGKHV